ncbi:MAG: hypothetical protein ABR501_15160 [Pyrinomonadaceae bacterium]
MISATAGCLPSTVCCLLFAVCCLLFALELKWLFEYASRLLDKRAHFGIFFCFGVGGFDNFGFVGVMFSGFDLLAANSRLGDWEDSGEAEGPLRFRLWLDDTLVFVVFAWSALSSGASLTLAAASLAFCASSSAEALTAAAGSLAAGGAGEAVRVEGVPTLEFCV